MELITSTKLEGFCVLCLMAGISPENQRLDLGFHGMVITNVKCSRHSMVTKF